jgi:hypothetical protein
MENRETKGTEVTPDGLKPPTFLDPLKREVSLVRWEISDFFTDMTDTFPVASRVAVFAGTLATAGYIEAMAGVITQNPELGYTGYGLMATSTMVGIFGGLIGVLIDTEIINRR